MKLKGIEKVLQGQAVSFEELAAPWSKGSVLILVKMLDLQLCDQMDNALAIIKGLELKSDGNNNLFDQFLQQGYLIIRDDVSQESTSKASQVLDYFRQKRLQPAAKAYLFIDEKLVEHSADSVISSWDLLKDLDISGFGSIAI